MEALVILLVLTALGYTTFGVVALVLAVLGPLIIVFDVYLRDWRFNRAWKRHREGKDKVRPWWWWV